MTIGLTPVGYHSPGIYISEKLQALSSPSLFLSPSTACFAGEHYRGPSVPVLCQSWGDFLTYFGGFNPYASAALPYSDGNNNPYLPFAVYEFFSNGGQQCWVYRIVNSVQPPSPGTPAASASVNIVDSSATPAINYVTFMTGAFGLQGNLGEWGNQLSVQISVSAATSSSTPQPGSDFSMVVLFRGSPVETWPDLSTNPSSSRYFVPMINSGLSGSAWIFARHNNPTDTTTPNPGTYQFANGIDPGGSWANGQHTTASVTDRTKVVTTNPNAPSPLDGIPGMINLNLPGETNHTVLVQGATYADGSQPLGSFRPFTFFVADTAQGQTPGQVISSGGYGRQSVAVYYPWVQASDPSSPNPATTVWLPPGGFVMGQYAAMDTAQGPWYTPAGIGTALNNVVAAESALSPAAIGSLTDNLINALRTLPSGQVVIWGGRTQLGTFPSKYLSIRRTLNYIESSLSQMLDFAIFQPNDPMLWAQISHICLNFLGTIYAKNGFPGPTPADSYYVICDTTNNTPQSIQSGVVNATVGVALEFPAEFIQLNIVQFQSSGQTTITTGPGSGPA
jgi:hypothetical protein